MIHNQEIQCPAPQIPEHYFMKWLRERMEACSAEINPAQCQNRVRLLNPEPYGITDGMICDYPVGINIDFSYKDSKYVKDVITKRMVQKQWNSQSPVFISAQTGSGKTIFVMETLLEHMILLLNNSDDRILLLCNRTALGRQNKHNLSERLIAHGDASYYHALQEYYQDKGIDRLCNKFGNIDVYSYQQLLEQDVLSQSSYKYIICDECHFFTSDAPFNKSTNNVLKNIVFKGYGAVRIYMSATPEIAFEPIIRMEWQCREKKKKELMVPPKPKDSPKVTRVDVDPVSFDYIITWLEDDDIRRLIQLTKPLDVYYYHLKRNYDYIEQVYVYREDQDLIEKIRETASDTQKWLVFVHGKNAGRSMKEKLTQDGISCAFITSDNKHEEGQEEFSNIAKQECFSQNVLIATSVLDNGVNVKDDNLCNVAIDFFDRVEFLQMLGRVRIPDKDGNFKIKLYIKKYDIEKLKEIVREKAVVLIKHLYWDIDPPTDAEKRLYNMQTSSDSSMNSEEVYCAYNPCEIYQILDFLRYSVEILRKHEPTFCIKFEDKDLDAKRERLIQWYRNGEGRAKSWGRTLIDIIESEHDLRSREKCKQLDLHWTAEDRYQYTLDDNFMTYIYREMIPKSIIRPLEEQFKIFFADLSVDIKSYITNLLERNKKGCTDDDFNLKKWVIIDNDSIKHDLSDKNQNILSHCAKDAERAMEEVSYWEKLADNEVTDPLDAQLRWIDREDYKVINEENSRFSYEDTYDEFIVKHAITEEELEKHKTGKSAYEYNFLEERGFKKDGDQAKQISKKYLDGGSLTNELKKQNYEISVKNSDGENIQIYTLKSCRSNRNKDRTYYVYILLSGKDEQSATHDPGV